MDWHQLYFGRVTAHEVKEAIKDEEWQTLRASMKGKSLEHKYWSLISYLDTLHQRNHYINGISGCSSSDYKLRNCIIKRRSNKTR